MTHKLLRWAWGWLAFMPMIPASAQVSPPNPESAAVQGGSQAEPAFGERSIEECWDKWLSVEGLKEGENLRGNNHFLLVSKAVSAVLEPSDSRNWLAAREAAFQSAELHARQALAQTLKTDVSTNRELAERLLGGDDAPPTMKPVVDQLSLSDKTRVLADKAVDAEIKKYDPKWSGESSQRSSKITYLQKKIDQNIESSTRIFASGAFTALQCEGPSSSDTGQYAVLVGMVWSPKLEEIAESIWDPSIKSAVSEPEPTLAAQFDENTKRNPDWLAYTDGVRVFTDDTGKRVIVGFGVAPRTALADADQSRARLNALAAIVRFVGEKIVADEVGKNQYEYRKYTDETSDSFNPSDYENSIKSVSHEIQISGTAEIRSWRGEHPWSKAGMEVVALAWTQGWSKDSSDVAKVLQEVEDHMEHKGLVPTGTKAQPIQPASHPTATKAKAGATSSTKNF